MKYLVTAYDKHGLQVLGNLDGQGIYEANKPERCNWFKRLSNFKTLNNRIAYYQVYSWSGHYDDNGTLYTRILNQTFTN